MPLGWELCTDYEMGNNVAILALVLVHFVQYIVYDRFCGMLQAVIRGESIRIFPD